MKTCKDCKQPKPFTDFYKIKRPNIVSNKTKVYYASYCKSCHYIRTHRNRQDPKNKKDEAYKDSWARKRVSMTRDEVLELIKLQNFECALCKSWIDENNFHLDHDHSTNIIRGVLCRKCNLGLGHFDDDIEVLQMAIDYLNRYNKQIMDDIIS